MSGVAIAILGRRIVRWDRILGNCRWLGSRLGTPGAVNADLVHTIAVPVAHDRDVARAAQRNTWSWASSTWLLLVSRYQTPRR